MPRLTFKKTNLQPGRPFVWLALLLAVFLQTGQLKAQESLRLLAFGDSLVHGYGLPAGQAFPDQLALALAASGTANGLEVEVINGGNSGDTTAAGLARLTWSLADNPDAVLVVLGGNDGLRGLSPDETYNNLSAILDTLAAREIPVLLAGMLAPRNLGSDYARSFDGAFARLARERQGENFFFYPFFLEGVAAERDLNQPDGIHPNEAGVAEIVRRILPQVNALLARSEKQQLKQSGQLAPLPESLSDAAGTGSLPHG
ncbi:arylesterase [Rhodovibrionaceae bacterium A322]